jgi:predicted SprT family Zn-dependent metalloprotease
MEVNMETQLPELQLELCELHSDPFLLTKKNENLKSFWKLICKDRFPNLRDLALTLHSVFGSTYEYTCECTFSTMRHVKSKNRNQMGDKTLDTCLRLSTTNTDIDMDTLVKEKPRPQTSH